MQQGTPRRPASLRQQAAEEIVGNAEMEERSDIAHESALALLGIASDDIDRDAIESLRQTVRSDGPEMLASLWDASPAASLPGALWRIYLLWQWNQMNPQIVEQRYAEGIEAVHGGGKASLPDTLRASEAVLTGRVADDQLAPVLEAAARVMEIMAAGVRYGPRWITEPSSELAHPVTRRPQALLDTAEELMDAARRADRGLLD